MKLFKKIFVKNTPKQLNILDVFNTILKLCQLGGMATVRYNRNKQCLEYSKLLMLFTTALLLFSCYHLSLIPRSLLKMEKESAPANITFLQLYEIVTSQQYIIKLTNPLLISIVSILSRFVVILTTNKHLPKILKYLNEVDESLKSSAINLRKNSKVAWIMVTIFVISSVPFQFFSVSKIGFHSIEIFFTFMFVSYNNFGSACLELQFFSICYFIYTRFKFINENLRTINVDETLHNSSKTRELFRNTLTPIDQKSNLIFVRDSVVIVPEDLIRLKLAHRKLSRVLSRTNSLYNVQLLIAVCTCVSSIFIYLYYSIYGGYNAPSSREIVIQPVDLTLINVTWAFYYLGRFVVICYPATLVTNEGNLTKIYVANFFNKELHPSLKEELKYFFYYTAAREGHLSVCGLFILDMRIITTAAATGITYLVILAQLHNTQ